MAVEAARDAEAFRAFEHEGWQRAADVYESSWERVTAGTAGALLDAARVGPGNAVLDVCCGPGTVAGAAAARGAEARGVDLSERFVAIARRRYAGARFEVGDAEALPFADGAFDAVVSGYGIIHLPRPAAALREMTRLLRPGGRLAVSVWGPPEPGTGLGVAFAAIQAHADLSVPLPHGPDFFQFSAPGALASALSGAGLADVSTVRVELTFQPGDYDLYGLVADASVRMGGLLRAQTPARRAAVREAVAAGVRALPDPAAIPMPALVSAGTAQG